MKKILFLLAFLLLLVGAKAEKIIEWMYTDTLCGHWEYDLDSTWWVSDMIRLKENPNWEDSIEQCKADIKEIELELSKYDARQEDVENMNFTDFIFRNQLLHWSQNRLAIKELQLQIFQLQAKLQRAGIE